jgi:hypothetical protein
MRMKEIRSKVREEMDDAKSKIHVEQAGELLRKERCRIQLNAS